MQRPVQPESSEDKTLSRTVMISDSATSVTTSVVKFDEILCPDIFHEYFKKYKKSRRF